MLMVGMITVQIITSAESTAMTMTATSKLSTWGWRCGGAMAGATEALLDWPAAEAGLAVRSTAGAVPAAGAEVLGC